MISLTICSFVVVISLIQSVYSANPHKKFEYKLSFKGPNLVQRDGSIPFWEHGGHAIASDESIRITPSLRSKKGYVWGKEQNPHANWEVEVVFRVSGRGRIGADGLAFWYTSERSLAGGPVFGAADQWNGLGVIFDSFDNDNLKNNPYIMAMVNDGTKIYDHQSDGAHQQLGGCLRDFRNKPFPIRAKIEYYQRALTISINSGMSNNVDDYELCMRAEDVTLPSNGYFGVSAATGGLADDHDVQALLTHSLTPVDDAPVTEQVPEDERHRFEQEFEEYWQKLQKAKEEFQRDNPDRQPVDDAKYFESQDIREIKQIFEGQNSIHKTIRDLHRKLDEVVGRQERTLSQISLMGSTVSPPSGGHQQQGSVQASSIQRHEVDSLLTNQRELLQTTRDLRNVLADVNSRTNSLQSTIAAGGGGGGGSVIDHSSQLTELKNYITSMQNDMRTLVSKPVGNMACPPPADVSCVSTFYFVMFGLLQVIVIVGYNMYKTSREAAAKKFY